MIAGLYVGGRSDSRRCALSVITEVSFMSFKRTPVALALASAVFSIGAGAAVSPLKLQPLHIQPQHIDLNKGNPLVGRDGKAGVIIKLKGEPATLSYARALRQAGN